VTVTKGLREQPYTKMGSDAEFVFTKLGDWRQWGFRMYVEHSFLGERIRGFQASNVDLVK